MFAASCYEFVCPGLCQSLFPGLESALKAHPVGLSGGLAHELDKSQGEPKNDDIPPWRTSHDRLLWESGRANCSHGPALY